MAYQNSKQELNSRHKHSSKQTSIQANKKSQQFLTKKDGHKEIRQEESIY